MPTLNALEWGGLWLYGSLLLVVLLWAWQGCVKAARWLGRRMEAAEQRPACDDSCGPGCPNRDLLRCKGIRP